MYFMDSPQRCFFGGGSENAGRGGYRGVFLNWLFCSKWFGGFFLTWI